MNTPRLPEEERQEVRAYRYFLAPDLDLGVDLSIDSLRGRSSRTIQATVAVAQESLSDYASLIFGRSDDDAANWEFSHVSEAVERQWRSAQGAFSASAGYNRTNDAGEAVHKKTDGLFHWHAGYAPVMNSGSPEKVKESGYGEMGDIMKEYFINEARQARGIATLDTPLYSMKLWDDDKNNDGSSDGFFGAPSLKTITNVAVSVAAYSVGAGPLVTAAINLIDDAVFTMADVATGYQQADTAFSNFGVGAGASLVGASVGGVFNGFDGVAGGDTFLTGGFNGMIGESGSQLANVAVDVGMGAAQSFTSNAAGGAISAFSYDGSWSFSERAYTDGLVGRSALAGYAGGAVQIGVGGLATNFLTSDGTGFGLNAGVFNTEALASVGTLAGSLSGAAVDYSIDGSASLSVLNSRSLGIERGSGILQLDIGRDGGEMNLGTGGYDTSLDRWATAYGGGRDIARITAAKIGGALGTERGITNRADLNLVNYNAHAGNLAFAGDVWSGSIETSYRALEDGYYGQYSQAENGTTIVLNADLRANDRESAAMLAAAGAHEGRHLYDRMTYNTTNEARAYLQAALTYTTLVEQLELNGNADFAKNIAMYLQDPESWQENQGDVDNMRPYVDTKRGVIGVRPANFFERLEPGLFGGARLLGDPDSGTLDMGQAGQLVLDTGSALGTIAMGLPTGQARTVLEGIGSTADVLQAAIDIHELSSRGDRNELKRLGMVDTPESLLAHLAAPMAEALNATALNDFGWFGTDRGVSESIVDSVAFGLADKLGIPTELPIESGMSEGDMEAAANEMWRNMAFLADMHLGHGLSTTSIEAMYFGTVGPQMSGNGLTWTEPFLGFEDRNSTILRNDLANILQTRDVNFVQFSDQYYANPHGSPEWMDVYGSQEYGELRESLYRDELLESLRRQQDNSAYLYELLEELY